MPDIPFSIPQSLASYVVQFETAPDKTIRRLKKQLKKRGPDPVGYFLLGWFYHCNGLDKKAIRTALKAKNFAPGSPFFEKLHYFFSHPQLFEAWQTHSNMEKTATGFRASSEYVGDLNSLIEKLSAMQSTRLRNTGAIPPDSESTIVEETDEVDDIVSETLAKIHEQQGKTEAAIQTYERLKTIHTDKKDFYDEHIQRLKKMKEQKNE